MPGGFQSQVYSQPAAAVAGDRADQNPIFSFDAGPGGLVSGSSLFVGRFAWATNPLDPNGTPTVANSFGAGQPAGFLMREQQALNTTFLSYAGQQVQPGAQVALRTAGSFWVVNDGANECQYGMKAYANLADGKVTFAAAGSPTTGPSGAASTIAASTFSVTGSISNNVLTATVIGSGTVVAGATISGTGVASGTKVQGQVLPLIAGEALGGIGRYYVSIADQTVASTTISGTYGTMTLGTVTGGSFAVGQQLNATGSVVAGTTITQLLTGTGGTGSTFVVDNNTVVGSQVITALITVETKFFARSAGPNGSVIKISSHTLASGQ